MTNDDQFSIKGRILALDLGEKRIGVGTTGRIEDGVLGQLRAADGSLRGVAATFAKWRDA